MSNRAVVLCLCFFAGSAFLGCVEEDPTPSFIGAGLEVDGGTDSQSFPEPEVGEVCTDETYPCGPYGHSACEVMEDLSFVPANAAAEALAGDDGIVSLSDIYSDETVAGLLLFGTAGWCGVCNIEASWLNNTYESYQDTSVAGARVEILTVVFQDDLMNPATLEYAEIYARTKNITSPVVADTRGDLLYYFDAASAPGNIYVDINNMKIYRIVQGFEAGNSEALLNTLQFSSVSCF